jgi:hypothetical protein
MKVPFLLLIAFFFAFIGCSGGDEPVEGVPTLGKSVDVLLNDAIISLKEEQWDNAVEYYNAAYNKDNNDARTIIYSVIASLAKISVDPKVVALMKNHFGFTAYPNRLNALFSDEWMKKYPDYIMYSYYHEPSGRWAYWEGDGYYIWEYDYDQGSYTTTLVSSQAKYDSVALPTIKDPPSWLNGSEAYQNAMFSGNVLSSENWAISLLANLLDKNTSGLNGLLDDVIDGVFGDSYNAAVEKLKKLENRKEERINLDPYFIEKLGLEDIFDEYDQIGWAEVNVILSATLLSKASLEWVQSYDLSSNLNWLKYPWKADGDDILEHFKQANRNDFPFNNNFFNVRPGKMANAKADYIKAIKGFQDSYTSIKNSELYPEKVKESYNTINEGFGQLIAAIENGGKFYVPEDPTKGAWPSSKSNAELTIDMGKFFAEGYFSLQNIFEVENGKPVFYSDDEKLTPANYLSLIDNNGNLQLNLNVGHIEAILDKSENGFERFGTNLDRDIAKAIFAKYYP